ncbi:DUF4386 family protein [Nocardia vulneris]|uniref:DUF4386 family protein n=1 Tax=Nocardia vulneris TaxID=1141657 RepID=A0ABR4Z576_9NOCA|nr:DUF4386 family protein [Nocardia vulneris]KIA60466.1 hypothetical protein FG87_36820 [Nocardia vulneris]
MTDIRYGETMWRWAAGVLLVGTLLYILPSALHGNPPIESASATLEYVRARPSWRLGHLVNIAAVIVWAFGFAALARVAGTPVWARQLLGLVFATAAATFAVYFSLHAFGLPTAAEQYFDTGANRAAILERTETILIVLGSIAFTAQALLGAAVLLAGYVLTRSVRLSGWLGWVGVVAGLGWLVGALLVEFAVVVPFTILTWVWTVVVAIGAWRAARPAASANRVAG